MNPINGFMPGPRPFNKSAPAVVCPSYPCDLEEALIQHLPSADVSFVYMIAFIIICIWNLGHVIQCRAVSFSRFMVVGSLLEAGGYVGRAILASLPFEKTPFLFYFILLTISPLFYSAAIYVTFSRVIVHYGMQHARFSPKRITITFVACDTIAVGLQVLGGGLAVAASTTDISSMGARIMVVGVVFELLVLLAFIALATNFLLTVSRVKRAEKALYRDYRIVRNNQAKQSFLAYFLYNWAIAILFMLTRSIYRAAELSEGFHSKLANQQAAFIVFESTMILLATLFMTVMHPGEVFSEKVWKDAGWPKKKALGGMLLAELQLRGV